MEPSSTCLPPFLTDACAPAATRYRPASLPTTAPTTSVARTLVTTVLHAAAYTATGLVSLIFTPYYRTTEPRLIPLSWFSAPTCLGLPYAAAVRASLLDLLRVTP